MSATKSESKEKSLSRAKGPAENHPSSVSNISSLKSEEAEISTNLSKSLALELMGLIKAVNKDVVTPESVNASCNAASQIYKILRLNFDMKKEGF